MPINWPPPTAPKWPPPEISDTWLSASSLYVLFRVLEMARFTTEPPTKDEHILYFQDARCDEGHEVLGRMFVSPDGKRRYPVAVCRDERHKDVLVQFPPYYCGFDSAKVDSEDGELTKVATIADKYWELTLVNPLPEDKKR